MDESRFQATTGVRPGAVAGGQSIVRATYPATLVGVKGRGLAIPRFTGQIEARVQSDALRLAGQFSRTLGSKEGRIKLPMADIVHASAYGARVELGLRPGIGEPFQRITLELESADAAKALAGGLVHATPWPAVLPGSARAQGGYLLWVPVLVVAGILVVVFAILLSRRSY